MEEHLINLASNAELQNLLLGLVSGRACSQAWKYSLVNKGRKPHRVSVNLMQMGFTAVVGFLAAWLDGSTAREAAGPALLIGLSSPYIFALLGICALRWLPAAAPLFGASRDVWTEEQRQLFADTDTFSAADIQAAKDKTETR